MSYAGHAFEKHFVISPFAGVLQTGDTSELAPGQPGWFTKDGRKSFTVNEIGAHKGEIKFGQGSWNTKDKIHDFFGGRKKSDSTKSFRGKHITKLNLHLPVKPVQKAISIGYNGVECCNPSTFECGKTYRLRMELKGRPIYRFIQHDYHKDYLVKTPCCDPCAEGCADGQVDSRFVFEEWARQINADFYAQKFVRASIKELNYSANPAAVSFTKYQITVPDEGDAAALAAIQSPYMSLINSNTQITRVKRSGIYSTYELIRLTSDGLPTAFTPVAGIGQPTCITCPAGWTTVPARDVYYITRALLPTTDLNSDADRTTFANTVGASYSATTQTFITNTVAFAVVQITLAAGTAAPTPVNSDLVQFIRTTPITCVPPANAAIPWVANGLYYKIPRTQCITLEKDCSGNSQLSAVQAAYVNVLNIVPGSIILNGSATSTDCGDSIQIQQYNKEYLQDGCFEPAIPTYDMVPGFNGIAWKDCPCPPAPTIGTNCVGLVLRGIYDPNDEQFPGCSFELSDLYDNEPVDFELFLYDESGEICNAPSLPVTILHEAERAQGLGYSVLKEYVRNVAAYKGVEWSDEPRVRQIWDVVASEIVKREKFYKLYNLQHYIPDHSSSRQHFEPEYYSYFFWVAEDVDTAQFEQYLVVLASQAGVELKVY